jgi:hypothetical protein
MVTLLVHLVTLFGAPGNSHLLHTAPSLATTSSITRITLQKQNYTPEKKERMGESVITCDAMTTQADTLRLTVCRQNSLEFREYPGI